MEIILSLKTRCDILFWFGLACFAFAIPLLLASVLKPLEFAGVNAWYKPTKFALSTFILSWSLAWYIGYLPRGTDLEIVAWTIVITLGFEVLYISYRAGLEQASHYNTSTPTTSALFSMMALAASIATLAVGYLGIRFCISDFPSLSTHYLWAIRAGLFLFVLFSFQGFLMGGRMAHTVGAPDGTKGLPFLNWSMSHGDLRIAHFLGMHSLQVLPVLSYFVLRSVWQTSFLILLYSLMAIGVLAQALRGHPLFSS